MENDRPGSVVSLRLSSLECISEQPGIREHRLESLARFILIGVLHFFQRRARDKRRGIAEGIDYAEARVYECNCREFPLKSAGLLTPNPRGPGKKAILGSLIIPGQGPLHCTFDFARVLLSIKFHYLFLYGLMLAK